MKININEGQFNAPKVPEGIYDVIPVNMTRKDSAKGNLCAYIQFQIQGGESADGDDLTGQKVLGMLVCIDTVLWKFNQLYKAVTGEDMPTMEFEDETELLDWLWEAINGQPLRAKVTERLYNDEVRLDLEYLSD